jgi:glycosidase
MQVHDDYKEGWNVASQVDDPDSVWSFWRKMLKLRKEYEALIYGKDQPSMVLAQTMFRQICCTRRQ